MANVQYTENMTEEQLDAMAGSETLRYQATSFGVPRNNKVFLRTHFILQLMTCVKCFNYFLKMVIFSRHKFKRGIHP